MNNFIYFVLSMLFVSIIVSVLYLGKLINSLGHIIHVYWKDIASDIQAIKDRLLNEEVFSNEGQNPLGLWNKYGIYKRNGEKMDPGAQYFVLRYDERGEKEARMALEYYAKLIHPTNTELSEDLYMSIDQVRKNLHKEDPWMTKPNKTKS